MATAQGRSPRPRGWPWVHPHGHGLHLRFAHDRDGVAHDADFLVVQDVDSGVGAGLGLARLICIAYQVPAAVMILESWMKMAAEGGEAGRW